MFLMFVHVCFLLFLDSINLVFQYLDLALRITLFNKFLYCLYFWSILLKSGVALERFLLK